MPREKAATIAKMSLLRPVMARIELARKASMARRQGLKPAKNPAAKTVATDDMAMCPRVSGAASLAHAGEAIVAFVELQLAKPGDEIVANIAISKAALMQSRIACILVSLDRCVLNSFITAAEGEF
jgi:hypothetical protein